MLQWQHTPRWIIFIGDLLICVLSVLLAYLLRFNFRIPLNDKLDLPYVVVYILGIRALSFYVWRTYAGIIRFTSTRDAARLFLVTLAGSVSLLLTDLVTAISAGRFLVPISIIIIDFLATVFFLISSRTLVKVLYFELINPSREKTPVIIYGAGQSGIIAKRTLDRDAGNKYKAVAFIDDRPSMLGKKLEGVPIKNPADLNALLQQGQVGFLIFSDQNISTSKKQEVIDLCFRNNTRVLNVPPASHWINGQLSFKQIKKISAEELLEREEIQLNQEAIGAQLRGKVVMVTGGAGSIGSELVRQIARFGPSSLVIIDQAESALYELEMELKDKFGGRAFEVLVADIRDSGRMERIIQTFRPALIYHAAAYKHVPLMEKEPEEAVRTNIVGTRILADLAVKYGVSTFVMISTDKAVNPTGVMGASKRVAEIYAQSLGKVSETKFITTRFGNVLGSNGSVIPLFRKQIEQGGPVTVTHPEITRYFMSIPEACQLVLEAGASGRGGEIYVFDMGKPVKIYELAKKMISLYGLVLDKDISIVISGLRPGEKLYEELFNLDENLRPTHHPKIRVALVKEYVLEEVAAVIDTLSQLASSGLDTEIVKTIKKLVPEYISNNSPFSELDKK
jgi:FlaA1/EpsC-like NDP-sugar epimerase